MDFEKVLERTADLERKLAEAKVGWAKLENDEKKEGRWADCYEFASL